MFLTTWQQTKTCCGISASSFRAWWLWSVSMPLSCFPASNASLLCELRNRRARVVQVREQNEWNKRNCHFFAVLKALIKDISALCKKPSFPIYSLLRHRNSGSLLNLTKVQKKKTLLQMPFMLYIFRISQVLKVRLILRIIYKIPWNLYEQLK